MPSGETLIGGSVGSSGAKMPESGAPVAVETTSLPAPKMLGSGASGGIASRLRVTSDVPMAPPPAGSSGDSVTGVVAVCCVVKRPETHEARLLATDGMSAIPARVNKSSALVGVVPGMAATICPVCGFRATMVPLGDR